MSGKRVPKPAKNELQDKYSRYGVTISSLAKEYNTTAPTVRGWLKYYNIPRKDHKQASQEANNRKRLNIPSRDELYSLYIDNQSTLKQMELYYSVGQKTIYEWLDKYNIERRDLNEACSIGKTKQFEAIQFDKKIVESLLEKYNHNKELVAEELCVSYSHIKKLIHKHGIISNYTSYKSKGELDIFEYCKEIRPDLTWISGDRSIINPYEIDIYCPELNIGIEYCGLYWHSEYYGQKKKDYHFKKWEKCYNKGVELITIFENDNIDKIKMLIKKKIGNNNRKVYGRQTNIKEIDSKIANQFHEAYHLHGSVGGSRHYGLYYQNDLLIVLSMGKSRFSSNYEWECTRLTNKNDVTVVGGASKLFAYFIKNENPKSIVTFADLRFGSGQVYNHCGFSYDSITGPNYWYFYKHAIDKLYSRVSFQKHKLKNKLDQFDESLTEYQNMIMNSYDRIWDCGNMKYVYYK